MSKVDRLTEKELEEILGGYFPVAPEYEDDLAIIKFFKRLISMFNELEAAGFTAELGQHISDAYEKGGKEAVRDVINQEATNPELKELLLTILDNSK